MMPRIIQTAHGSSLGWYHKQEDTETWWDCQDCSTFGCNGCFLMNSSDLLYLILCIHFLSYRFSLMCLKKVWASKWDHDVAVMRRIKDMGLLETWGSNCNRYRIWETKPNTSWLYLLWILEVTVLIFSYSFAQSRSVISSINKHNDIFCFIYYTLDFGICLNMNSFKIFMRLWKTNW